MSNAQKMVEAARKTLRVMTWTPSRFAEWKECPQKVLLKDLMKMCPVCFAGRVSGGYDGDPVVCDTCSKDQPERPALDRGNRLDAALTRTLAGPKMPMTATETQDCATQEGRQEWEEKIEVSLAEATRHPWVRALVQKLRKTKSVFQQASIVLDPGWKPASKGQYTKNAFARLKLDVLVLRAKVAEIIDWKSGNIDKSKGEIRERADYHEAMRMYQAAVLSVYPQAEASATMVFIDAPPKLALPIKSLPVLKRRDLRDAQADIERKVAPMLNDTIFAPRPGYYCGWCPFQKAKGGPCPF